ncbi:MAG TPA: hypothetical protein VGG75_26825 [Trebonia sp.]|jgi:hypothetical protein
MFETITRRPGIRRAWTGVLLGAVGLFVLNVVFGPIAIGLGVTSLRRGARIRAAPGRAADRAAGVASIVLGVTDLVVLAALISTSLGHGGLVWHFGS